MSQDQPIPFGEPVPMTESEQTQFSQTLVANHASPPRRVWPLITIIVLAVMLLLVTVSLLLVNKNTYDELQESKASLAQTQTDLANTQEQLTGARTEAGNWRQISDAWRECGGSLLETVDGLVNDGLLGGLAPIGGASATCEAARNLQTELTGSSGV